MKNKRLINSLIVSGVIMSLFIIVSMANFVIYGKYRKINHFDDIAVCEAFDEYATKNKSKINI